MASEQPYAPARPDDRDARSLAGLRRAAAAVGILVLAAAGVWLAWAWHASRVPDTFNVMDYGAVDYGGGPVPAGLGHAGHGAGAPSVAALTGPQTGEPDVRYTLTARRASVRLPSGRTVEALTFDGRVPGPELRARRGDLVEVTVRNTDVAGGVSVHFHGLDVPNAEDGVAGVTQDAVPPGGRHTYRFRVEQEGTFWYHTHQRAAQDVSRGLFGAFVIEPRATSSRLLDLPLLAHSTDGRPALSGHDGLARRDVAPGTPVRLRLVNATDMPRRFVVAGTSYRVAAIDGADVHRPTPVRAQLLELGGGGRYDVAFTMPSSPVTVALEGTRAALVLGRGRLPAAPATPATTFDPAGYGSPASAPFGARSRFDRRFELTIGKKVGFLDGRPGVHWALNGRLFPDTPVFVVEKGDLVHVTIENDTRTVHPMHLHGHHVLVLSRAGMPARGAPWWVDTLNVEPGERYEVAFRAANTGVWMFHCHNLGHAAEGMTMHLAYAGVATPFSVGGRAGNRPE